MKLSKLPIILLATAFVTACGGGGGGDTSASSNPNLAELQGVWIYSSDSHYTGGACGLDNSGNYGRRLTFTLSGNTFTSKDENCLILTGNTGGYIETNSGNGTINIGDIYLTDTSNPDNNLRAIDFITNTTLYTSYRVTNSKLYLADSLRAYDGSTPALRASYVTGRVAFVKQ